MNENEKKNQEVNVEQNVTPVNETEQQPVPAEATPKKGLIRKFGEKIVKDCDKRDTKKAEKLAKKAAKADKKHLTKGQKIGVGVALALALGGGAVALANKPTKDSSDYELGPDDVADNGTAALPASTETMEVDIPETEVEG